VKLLAGPKMRLAVLAAAVAALFALAAQGVPHSPAELRDAVAPYGPWAALVVVLLWAALTPALVSGTLLAGATGLLFGAALGTPLALAGATLGGAVSFLIARRCGGNAVEQLAGRRLRGLVERVEGSAFGSIVLLRLAPGVPATLLNYAAGLTRMRLRTFAAANAVGGAPRTFAYVALGGSLSDLSSPLTYVALGLLAAMGAAGTVAIVVARLRSRAGT
jgi:uncharacterized membrane protein YdjX (TVP38/TMEM64 family)